MVEDISIVENKLILNNQATTIYNEIAGSLETCNNFYFNIAFINYGGLQLFLKTFLELSNKNIKGKIITSTYLNFTEPKALRKILEFPNIDLKVYGDVKTRGFHSKAYIFEFDEYYKIMIGSANMTCSALKSNIEWNIQTISKKDHIFSTEVINEFTNLWESLDEVSEEFLERYETFIRAIKASNKMQKNQIFQYDSTIKPNSMQKMAILNLNKFRQYGEKSGLVIAATGTGKTYMSAFDVLQMKPKKVLFLVHREDILKNAEESFKRVLGSKIESGFFVGREKNDNAKYLFSTMQTMNNNFELFDATEFEYIIIDEAHHVTSSSYQKMLKHFKPKFLLGMTATPERSDGADIFEQFDNNIAIEVRLQEALEEGLVAPFHYFGITDISSIDLSNVKLEDLSEISKRLKVHERVDFIIKQMNLYGHDGDKLKCLGFCVTKDHAKYMSDEFNQRGINSIWLADKDNSNERQKQMKRLEDDQDKLKVIFTVGIFNEGIDIPSVNMVLMLRPTNSPIIFIQQLGRGLRKFEGKEYLTVLDFIGNYNRAYLIAIALKGSRYYDKDSIKVSVKNNFSDIAGDVFVQMDEIAKDRILKQLNNENFNHIKYLKEEYISFKTENKGIVPKYLMDYIKYEGAPDPLRFIKYSKTYIAFLAKVEKSNDFNEYLLNEGFMNALKYLSLMLPIKRPNEFVILHALLYNEKLSKEECISKISRYMNSVSEESVVHSMENLDFKFFDSAQIGRSSKLVEYTEGCIACSTILKKIKSNKRLLSYIEDTLNYGLRRYEKEFGDFEYRTPFFKLYSNYTMQDAALLSNFEKTFSSFRGSGLLVNKNDYFLFVDLHKEESIKESINYKDKFIDRTTFQWESPNTTKQDSERGKNIILNKEREIHLHLFVKKFKIIDGVSQPYIYLGLANSISYENNKPIKVILKLENEISYKLYNELITKVE
ncbi:MAG: DEAD/DEAH box helicase [Longicatena sp.]